MKARPDETLTISVAVAGFEMRQKLLHHAHRPVQVDLDLARYVVQIASLIEGSDCALRLRC
jgi:hypothetical protein